MSADILIHRAKYVPVGKDQEQHLEIARNYAQRFNHRYDEVFPEPQAFNFGSELVKVPSLDGKGKMSKSENQNATIYLADTDESIRSKFKKAKSDAAPTEANSQKSEAVENLFNLMKLVSDKATLDKFEADFNQCTIRYGEMKEQLAEDTVKFVRPIREKADALRKDEAYLNKVMKEGAAQSRESAARTIEAARKAMGLQYF
jgi:tryptophanyl-tRNA synthetase